MMTGSQASKPVITEYLIRSLWGQWFPSTSISALAGLPIPEGLDGVDFHELLADPETAKPPRDFAASASFAYGVRINYNTTNENQPWAAMRLVRDQHWKYVEVEKVRPCFSIWETIPWRR